MLGSVAISIRKSTCCATLVHFCNGEGGEEAEEDEEEDEEGASICLARLDPAVPSANRLRKKT